MQKQITLTNKIATDKTPIILEIEFVINNGTLHYDGRAYPNISSGCSFGGCSTFHGKKQIDAIVDNQIQWFKDSYNRPVKKKITIRGTHEHITL